MKSLRLFISSTFNDFAQERDAIQKDLLPHLSTLCKSYNVEFMPIDLRWGVANEAQNDQKTIDLCLSEVRACKGEPNPDFLILAGDRYGWVPLPYKIEKEEFEALKAFVPQRELELLTHWYILDLNQIPHSYILQKREDQTKNKTIAEKFRKDYISLDMPEDKEDKAWNKAWAEDEQELRIILQNAITQTSLPQETKEKYFTSAIEFEFDEYMRDYVGGRNEALFVVDRNINANAIVSSKYFDNSARLKPFKAKLKTVATDANIILSNATLKDSETLEESHIKKLINELKTKLSASIEKELQRVQKYDEAIGEQEQHQLHKNSLLENNPILGRDKEIEVIQAYIQNKEALHPYIIYGSSGLGKSSLLASSISKSEERLKEKVIYRFCGTTPDTSSTRSLLRSILKELEIELPEEEQDSSDLSSMIQQDSKKEDTFELEVQDTLLAIKENVVIYIDALDQLSDNGKCEWLPYKLPSNLKIVITVLKDENYKEDSHYYEKLNELGFSMQQLLALDDKTVAKDILLNTLKRYNRTLQEQQVEYILDLYKNINSPLYLTIVAQEALHWSSTQTKLHLASSQRGAIEEFIENLTEYYHHSKLLVERVFGYVFASQNSLSETMLYEILSNDSELIKSVENKYHKNLTKKLPTAVWARLHYQIKPFLKESSEGTLGFFHREFRDGAKALYSEELSQKLLGILEKMLDAASEEENKQLTEIYIKTLTNQKYEHQESSIEKQVAYIVGQDEIWVEELLKKIFKQGKIYAEATEDLWAIAYEIAALDITKLLYKENLARWAEKHIQSLNNLAFSYSAQSRDAEARKLRKEAHSITKPLYTKNPVRWAENYIQSLNNLALSLSIAGAIEIEEEALSITKALYKENPAKWAENYTRSLNNLALSYNDQNKFDEAIELQEETLYIAESLYKKNTRWAEDYTRSLYNLATFYENKNRLSEAIELRVKNLSIAKVLYEKKPAKWAGDYISSLNRLASFYYSQNSFDEAIELYQGALSITKVLYEENPARWTTKHTLSLNDLASCYYSQNSFDEAIELYQKVFSITKVLYKENPVKWVGDYISSLNNLAMSYRDQNKFDEAIELQEETLYIAESLYKKNTRWAEDYTRSLYNLAMSYKNQNKFDKSIKLFEKALVIIKALHADDYDRWVDIYISSLNNLAHCYYVSKNKKKSLDMFKEAYEEAKKIFGESHLSAQNCKGNYLHVQAELDDSDNVQDEDLSIRKVLYEENPGKWEEDYTLSLIDLATSYYNQNRLDEAIPLYEESLKIHKELYQTNPDRWAEYYTTSLNNLAASYKKQNRLNEAIPLHEESLKIHKELYLTNPDRWAEDYTRSLNNLSFSYYKQNCLDEAIELQEESLEIRKELYQANPQKWAENYTTSLNNLSSSYKKQNRLDEAIALQEESLEIRKELYQANPKRWAGDYATSLNNLATSHYNKGEKKRALDMQREAYEVAKDSLGESHPNTQTYKRNHLHIQSELGGSENNFDQEFTTLLYLAKGIATGTESTTIELIHLFYSYQFVELNKNAQDVFTTLFGEENMANLEKSAGGEALLEMAKSYPQVLYSSELKPLIEELQELFGNEKICKFVV